MFSIQDILMAIPKAVIVQNGKSSHFSTAIIDSRGDCKGKLFFAIQGKRDGHDFIDAAFSNGAAGAITSKAISTTYKDTTIIQVPDTLIALQKLAHFVRLKFATKVVAITGSAGKTTTKDICAFLLAANYNVLKSPKSFNNQYGVPLSLLALQQDHEHAIIEIGTNHHGEILPLTQIAAPDAALITNIGFAHIENFGALEETLKEKSQIFATLRAGNLAIINNDDKFTSTLIHDLAAKKVRVFTIGIEKESDLQANEIEVFEGHTKCKIRHQNQHYSLTINAMGRHLVYSCLFAIAYAYQNGISIAQSTITLQKFQFPKGRSDFHTIHEQLKVIDDTYNASPDAVLGGLNVIAAFQNHYKIAVLGEMRELGDFGKYCHRLVGEVIAEKVDYCIGVGGLTHFIAQSAIEKGMTPENIWTVSSAMEAFLLLKNKLATIDKKVIVYVKGSRFMHMERVVLGLQGLVSKCQLGVCSLYINCKQCKEFQ